MNEDDLRVMRESLRPKEGSYCFGNKHVKVIKSLEIPVEAKGRKFSLTTEVVEGDIPWLLGKTTLIRMGAILDIRTGYMKITDLGNVKVPMEENSGGHLVVRLKEQPKTRYVWWRTTDWLENEKEWKKYGRRLHLQFGHCSDGQIMNMLDKTWKEETVYKGKRAGIREIMKDIYGNCQICNKYRKNTS